MADFEDSTTPTWENRPRRPAQPSSTPSAAPSPITDPTTRQGLRPQREPRRPLRSLPAAGTSKSATSFIDGEPFCPAPSSTSPSTSSTTPKSCSPAAPALTSTSPKWSRDLEARLWNSIFTRAQELLGIPHGSIKRDRAHRNHPRHLRNGRDPLRTPRPLRRPQLRPLGLHLQLHQKARRRRNHASP